MRGVGPDPCPLKRSGRSAPERGGHSPARPAPAGHCFYSASAARQASCRRRELDVLQQAAAASSLAGAASERGASFTDVKSAGALRVREPRVVGADPAGIAQLLMRATQPTHGLPCARDVPSGSRWGLTVPTRSFLPLGRSSGVDAYDVCNDLRALVMRAARVVEIGRPMCHACAKRAICACAANLSRPAR